MKVHVDLDTCCGHGRCYALCPEVFGEDDEGYPLVSEEVIEAKQKARVRRAAANCPEAAITLVENGE